MRKFLSAAFLLAAIVCFPTKPVNAQQYKIRQVTSIAGMQTSSTVYVKGPRKRTESEPLMGMSQPTTIIQCDLKRTIKLNDKKKLYFIIPFNDGEEEIIDEDAPPTKTKPVPVTNTTKKGGVITMYYTITDTGERKKMHGLTARHVWTYNKMKASPDACYMKDSFIIKTDGWYVDLPEFNCPVSYKPSPATQASYQKPDCQDRFVTRRKGKGKLGFPLTETTTMIMGGKASEFTTSLETLEFSTAKLDSMLFTIPPGYTEAKSEEELNDKMDITAMMNQYKDQAQNKNNDNAGNNSTQPKAGGILVGVYEPKGDNQVSSATLQQHIINSISGGNIQAIAVTSPEDAKSKNCTYTLNTDITKVKQASKVGGLLKAIKNTDPSAVSSFNVEGSQTLIKLSDGSIKIQPRINGKYEGKMEDAVKKGVEEACSKVVNELH